MQEPLSQVAAVAVAILGRTQLQLAVLAVERPHWMVFLVEKQVL